ncbi:MAG: hypothetical protein H0U44_09960 [Flavisolibacter sp.]|jgi:hypothetical protein|nr:hypothetical protein [Flavisolibacter sp.]
MENIFHPFTTEIFQKETGLVAADNEAIYFRWLNAQMNYANFKNMQQMNAYLKDIIDMLRNNISVLKK